MAGEPLPLPGADGVAHVVDPGDLQRVRADRRRRGCRSRPSRSSLDVGDRGGGVCVVRVGGAAELVAVPALSPACCSRLNPLQRIPIQDDDALIEPIDARVLVFGMGRVGAGVYDGLVSERGPVVLGVDRRDITVGQNVDQGRNVIRGDVLDSEFWARLQLHAAIDVVVLAMSDHEANLEAIHQVRSFQPEVAILATALFADEAVELADAGAAEVRNLYDEVGQGLADDVLGLLRRHDDGPGGDTGLDG